MLPMVLVKPQNSNYKPIGRFNPSTVSNYSSGEGVFHIKRAHNSEKRFNGSPHSQ